MSRKTDTPEWISWYHMVQRCLNPSDKRYARYGGRGITVSERWRDSFEAFLADMGPRPSASHSIDRIDNDRGYEPGNCRWATPQQQRQNRSDNHYIVAHGQRRTITEWAVLAGLATRSIRVRLQNGWTPERAVTEAPRIQRSKISGCCPQGHPYEGRNVRVNRRGARECRACDTAEGRKARARAARAKESVS